MALFAGYALHALFVSIRPGFALTDDAYYYIVLVRRMAHSGVSSFDGLTPTNGYQPLWMAALLLEQVTVGAGVPAVLLLEAALLAAAILILIRQGRGGHPLGDVLLAVLFVPLMRGVVMIGMETSSLVLAIGLFVWALRAIMEKGGAVRAVLLGLAAAAVVAGRIDAGAFVAPAIVLARASRRDRATALAVLVLCGAGYAAANQIGFGTALPISGAVKSLGGLQIDRPLLRQMGEEMASHAFLQSTALTLLLFAATPILWFVSPKGSLARTLAVASVIGGVIYFTRLVFFSSWQVWGWYQYVRIFPLLVAYYAAAPRLRVWFDGCFPARPLWIGIVCATLLLVVPVATLAADLRRTGGQEESFHVQNREAARRFAPLFAGVPVAMGDRAGSFAEAYPGPVVQLEGLMGDVAYLNVLRGHGDLKTELCGKGVRFLLAYAPPLGRYDGLDVPAFSPFLTQFAGPSVRVSSRDEVGWIGGSAVAKPTSDRLYVWRLACPGAGAVAPLPASRP